MRLRGTRLTAIGSGRGVLTTGPVLPTFRIVRTTGDRRIVRGGDPRITRV